MAVRREAGIWPRLVRAGLVREARHPTALHQRAKRNTRLPQMVVLEKWRLAGTFWKFVGLAGTFEFPLFAGIFVVLPRLAI